MVYPPQRTVDELLNSLTATYVTGSSLLSGSDIRGPTATITKIYATNVTGSSTVSGSTLLAGSGGLTVGGNAYVTGSTYLSQYGTDYGIVLRLDFEEGSGSTTYDSSPYGNDGAISGAAWVDGKYGKALRFNGANDYVDCGSGVAPTTGITLSTWINPDVNDDWKQASVIAKMDAGSPYLVWKMGLTSAGKLRFDIRTNGETLSPVSAETIPISSWTLITATFDGRYAKIYIDGVYYPESTVDLGSTHSIDDLSDKTYIGYELVNGRYFDGIIDETRIYNRALTVDEIRNLWLSSTAKYTSSTIISDKFRVLGTDLNTKLTLTNTDLSTGAGVSFSPPTGSASGSLVASLTMAVNVTGSTYYIQLWK